MAVYKDFFDYLNVKIPDDICLVSATNLLREMSCNIFELKKRVGFVLKKPNPNIILSTAHTFKGLEADSVYIMNDLKEIKDILIGKIIKYREENPDISLNYIRRELTRDEVENLNIYYVAISRAKHTLRFCQ